MAWLRPPAGCRWLDVGCGTGALTDAVLAGADPAAVLAVDRSPGFLATARRRLEHRVAGIAVAGIAVADAATLPVAGGAVDHAVSGLVLNFLPDPAAAVAEMARACGAGGVVAAYVWDYADGMAPIRLFWEAAAAIDPAAAELDEGRRFPLCRPGGLTDLLAAAGLTAVEGTAITVPTRFRDFADYWTPFLGGQGPAPGYCAALPEDVRGRLRDRLRSLVPTAPDGGIPLTARAWAARGTVPAGAGAPAVPAGG